MFPFRGIGDVFVGLRDFLKQVVGVNDGLVFAFSRRLRLPLPATAWCFRLFFPLVHISLVQSLLRGAPDDFF